MSELSEPCNLLVVVFSMLQNLFSHDLFKLKMNWLEDYGKKVLLSVRTKLF